MTLLFQSHGGKEQAQPTGPNIAAAHPALPDIAVDEQADFGFLFPPGGSADDYLPEGAATVADLDKLGDMMIDQVQDPAGADADMDPVLTYWGQFLDHELTARTDRESMLTNIKSAHPPTDAAILEKDLKNARSPRFDLDSVYGGLPFGPGMTADIATVISGMRHPSHPEKMRVGTAVEPGPLPDALDPHRDLPRYVQVQASVREAALRVAQASMSPADFAKFQAGLPQRALIGDQRNDENLVIAQFHLSFLRFHNRAVDFLKANPTGWLADFHSAQALTRLHYQWLIVHGYLKGVCQPAVVDAVLADRASHFFRFRAEYDARRANKRLGNALPFEFSVAAYRFGHSMVRAAYDHNNTFGRPGGEASLDLLFAFTGGGGAIDFDKRLPKNWVIDWSRFVGTAPNDGSDGLPARLARKIDTALAPPLGDLVKEANDEQNIDVKRLFRQLARRNLRRGYNMRLPTGQALHAFLQARGAVASAPIADIGTVFAAKPAMRDFLQQSGSHLHQKTPLWFYILAEAEREGGNRLGELGSWLVASTFIGVLLADPDSAVSKSFEPDQSPLRLPGGGTIDTIADWMRFALVMP